MMRIWFPIASRALLHVVRAGADTGLARFWHVASKALLAPALTLTLAGHATILQAAASSTCEINSGSEYCEPKQYLWGAPSVNIGYQWSSFGETASALLPRMIETYNNGSPNNDYYSKWEPRQPLPSPNNCYNCAAYTHQITTSTGQLAVEDVNGPGATYHWTTQSWNAAASILCPSGMTATTGTGTSYCSRTGPDPDKDLGGPGCEAPTGPQDGPPPEIFVFNPVHARSGNKYQREVDYTGQGPMPLTFVRSYNSAARAHRYIGALWSHSYDRRIVAIATNSIPAVSAVRAEGQAVRFSYWGSAWRASNDVKDTLQKLLDGGGAHIGWELYVAATEETEIYDASGNLISITSRAGLVTTLTYSDASTPLSVAPRAGLLIRVADPFRRELNFTYDEERIISMTDPDGQVYAYVRT